MKKTFYTLLTINIFLISTGFRGCENAINPLDLAFGVLAGHKFIGLDNIEVYYAVVCGENGKIYTSEGRPPAPWIARNSGITQRLNGVKCVNSDDSSVAFA